MLTHRYLSKLIDANAPLWAGEAEVFRVYWDSPIRTRETDLLWLLRQAYKEYWDGFVPPLERLNKSAFTEASPVVRASILDDARTAAEEYAHYCLFADAYEQLREHRPPLEPGNLKAMGDWEENRTLMQLRRRHKEEHGMLGERAHRFTEGGYCTLYAEGMKLADRGGADEIISMACTAVYEEEFEHMLKGIAGLESIEMDSADWDLLTSLTVEQMNCRIRMRNAQFSHPIAPEREQELCTGAAEPLSFDYAKAGLGVGGLRVASLS